MNTYGETSQESASIQEADWRLRIADLVGFQVGWFTCVLGAASNNPFIGPFVVGVLALLHLGFYPFKKVQLRLLILAAILGILVDGSLLYFGIFSFTGTALPPILSPLWLTAMWCNFAITLPFSMSWLSDRYLLGALLGAVGGPAAYFAGARLGAITFDVSLPLALLLLAVAWAIALPLLLYWARRKS